jgi:hypothetical protein
MSQPKLHDCELSRVTVLCLTSRSCKYSNGSIQPLTCTTADTAGWLLRLAVRAGCRPRCAQEACAAARPLNMAVAAWPYLIGAGVNASPRA